MTLRNNPDVKAASQALAFTRARGRDRDLSLARVLALADDLADDLAGDLADIRGFADTGGLAVFGALDLARTLAGARARIGVLGHDLPGDLADILDLARSRAEALAYEIAALPADSLTGDIADILDLANARVLGLARVLALDLADGDALALTRARDVIVEVRAAEVGRAIGLALHREPFMLNKDSLHALLDDFTATDLSSADLTGTDLRGIYWSEHTTLWPPSIDVEDLKTHSDESPPGSGTWIVRSGTATIRDHAER
ncbi:hypothetical protein [Streptomyces sp. YS415]|uniref:hypothetical protein n=1 Tax=Streptomyces sp. YS415 TaxID=2944806 RepID=UPI002020BBFF|nr:hypothetical protein [Streptomyces sp. YS415]MCL7430353.1 hypothetical protein [Streptomyces sp. YS415]